MWGTAIYRFDTFEINYLQYLSHNLNKKFFKVVTSYHSQCCLHHTCISSKVKHNSIFLPKKWKEAFAVCFFNNALVL